MPDSICRNSVGWADAKLIAETREVWQPYYAEQLTDEDVYEILFTVRGILECVEGTNDAA